MSAHDPHAAFPFVSQGGLHEHQLYGFGLTKRELFAAMAMQGMCANPQLMDNDSQKQIDWIAVLAEKQADALLKSLEQQP